MFRFTVKLKGSVFGGLVFRRIGFLIKWLLCYAIGVCLVSNQRHEAIRLARILYIYFPYSIKQLKTPQASAYVSAFLYSRVAAPIVQCLPRYIETDSAFLNHCVGTAHLIEDNPEVAIQYFKAASNIEPNSYTHYKNIGKCFAVLGERDKAIQYFLKAINHNRHAVMGHQNYAGRYDIAAYQPDDWEFWHAPELNLYDNLIQVAEDQFLAGDLPRSMRTYQAGMRGRAWLVSRYPIPYETERAARALVPNHDRDKPLRILSYEWVTQFGHIALIDSHLKMAELGLIPQANDVVLAPDDKVANQPLLDCWTKRVGIVRDKKLIDALFVHQRAHGENFIALPMEDGEEADPWTRRAAIAQDMWSREGKPPLIQLDEATLAMGRRYLRELGLPVAAWYVGLHVREGGFHGDAKGTGSDHRNSRVEDYLSAVAEITRRGGWVIRLGDPSMTPLPQLDQVVDYAHSAAKSTMMDLFLLATSRFVVGTTSGLTTAAIAFGTPMVLVNCISNDWQMWSGDTHFTLKLVRNWRTDRVLPLSQIFRRDFQGRLINDCLLWHQKFEVLANTPEDILDAVRYKLDILEGRPASEEDTALLARFRAEIAHEPALFGGAVPVPSFLRAHPQLFSETLPAGVGVIEGESGRCHRPASGNMVPRLAL